MDSSKLVHKGSQNNFGEAEDRISKLPDSLLLHILSFIKTKSVVQTSVLSKRWNRIWTSVPTLDFPGFSVFASLSKINNFMDFVDRTLLLHDSTSIEKFSLYAHADMNESRIHPWISNITKKNVKELRLFMGEIPFSFPSSLFTCESLVILELCGSYHTHLPTSICFPKLKSLTLHSIEFTDDCSWNEQHLSKCPVLEILIFNDCTWSGRVDFCISSPALKLLEINNVSWNGDENLWYCALKINAPNLVSFAYGNHEAKEYVFSSFQTLESARFFFCGRNDENTGAAVSEFFRAFANVRSLNLSDSTLEAMSVSVGDNLVNILPTFHNLEELFLGLEDTTDNSVFPLLKAAPNLTRLILEYGIADNEEEEDSWAGHMLIEGCSFQNLQSVCFQFFVGGVREMRWLKLILKKARALQTISIGIPRHIDAKTKELLMLQLPSLPKASAGCVFDFSAYEDIKIQMT